MEDLRRGAPGPQQEKPGSRHEQPRKPRPVPGRCQVTNVGGAGCPRSVSLQDLELSPRGARAGGGADGRERGGGGRERDVGLLSWARTALGPPFTCPLGASGPELQLVGRSGPSGRAPGTQARALGAVMGPSAARGSPF